MSAIASVDEQWYFLPPQICFHEYALCAGQKSLHQKVLARSTQQFQTASVELTSFSLDCFGIIGTSVLENAGPDSTFVFSVSFDIPPPEGLLLLGEYHSNLQDQLHIRHSVSGEILATLVVKAIWDLTPDTIAAFYPPTLPPVPSSCAQVPHKTAAPPPRVRAGTSKQNSLSASTSYADDLRRPVYDEAEDSFYRSLLAGAVAQIDKPISTSISAPKDCRIQLSADDAAFYSSVIAGVTAAPGVENAKKANATKTNPSVHFEGDDIIVIDGIKYDTWGNMIASGPETSVPLKQDPVEELVTCDMLAAKKKLPQLGPTTIRGSNVPVMTSQVIPAGERDDYRYLEILEGNIIPETQNASELRASTVKRPGKFNVGAVCHGSVAPSQVATSGAKSAGSTTFPRHQQKPQSSSVLAKLSKKEASQCAVSSPVKSEDQLNDAWDAL
jgi:hypothetical protein